MFDIGFTKIYALQHLGLSLLSEGQWFKCNVFYKNQEPSIYPHVYGYTSFYSHVSRNTYIKPLVSKDTVKNKIYRFCYIFSVGMSKKVHKKRHDKSYWLIVPLKYIFKYGYLKILWGHTNCFYLRERLCPPSHGLLSRIN